LDITIVEMIKDKTKNKQGDSQQPAVESYKPSSLAHEGRVQKFKGCSCGKISKTR
jgi:hypothetical protein